MWQDEDTASDTDSAAPPRAPAAPPAREEAALHLETLCIHGSARPGVTERALVTPICLSAAFEFDDAAHAAALFDLSAQGDRYARIGNPSNASLERRIAALEGGAEALVTASGQAALHYAIAACVAPGTTLVSSPALYGTTHTLFTHLLAAQGITVRFARSPEPADILAAIDGDTRAVFCETFANPGGEIADIEAIACAAHAAGVPLIMDNTFATPALVRPIAHGADIVVHSLTKFMGGHGTALGGAIIDGGRFRWAARPQNYPGLTAPDPAGNNMIFTERFGATAYIARCRNVFLRVYGAALSPLSAFLIERGLETLALRMERHVHNANAAASFLRRHDAVSWVSHAGHPGHASHDRLRAYANGAACPVFTFGLKGGLDAARRFYDSLELIKRAVNVGDVRSLACHPASTTHRQMPLAAMRAAGILPEAVRLSIGLEHEADIVQDLDQALRRSALPRAA